MVWSLTQRKLLGFNRLLSTDTPMGALMLPGPTLWGPRVATPGMPQLWLLAVCRAGGWA
ncbi:hypothetical protein [Salmonella enterica]|uniref:hypothetical protein n=1 Tax=Salmonella enterica TaxID=28901 RepID=UPI000A8FE4F1